MVSNQALKASVEKLILAGWGKPDAEKLATELDGRRLEIVSVNPKHGSITAKKKEGWQI